MKPATATMAGSILGSVLASLCCIVPLGFALLGISGAGFALRFEPWRPHLLLVTFGLLGGAFYFTYRPAPVACEPGEACEPAAATRAAKAALWIATVVVLLTSAFPLYSAYLF